MSIVTKYPILAFFEFAHLPHHLQRVSKPMRWLAKTLACTLPEGAETAAGLRKLMEAKDCFVRAALSTPLEQQEKTQAERDEDAVQGLALAMESKLAECRDKGKYGWADPADCTQQHLSNLLHRAVAEGRTVDVANYCAFLFSRAEAILPRAPVIVAADADTHTCNRVYGEAYGIDWTYPES